MSAGPKGPKRLADLVRPALEPVLAKRGLSQASLVLDWSAIAGARFAALCEPARLQWPPRGPKSDASRGTPAILWLRVAPGRALDVQYQAPALIERVNAYFGWRCVAAVKVAPEPKRSSAAVPAFPEHDPGALARAGIIAGRIEDDRLRGALTRLGAGVLSPRRR